MIANNFYQARVPHLVHGATAVVFVVALVASGCTGTRTVASNDAPELSDRLRREVRTWEGTPHRLGGESRAGADCSGFVMRIYEDVFGVSLPRTTEDQAREGEQVSDRSLVPGDLVFFRTAPKTRHVGIYLSDGEFAHASSSAGVRVSSLDEDYWQRTYWMSRRVADLSHATAAMQEEPESEVELTSEPRAESPMRRARTGW